MTIESYRKKPFSQQSPEERKKYAMDLKKRDGSKFKKGEKVLINLRGKNVEAVIEEDMNEKNTSLKVLINGKVMRKDLATVYGIVGEKPEEAKPPAKLIELKKKTMPVTPRPKTPPKTPRKISEGIPPKKVNKPRPMNKSKKLKCATKMKKDGDPYTVCY